MVLISTIFFATAGIQNWRNSGDYLGGDSTGNAIVFTKVGAPLMEEGETGLSLKELFGIQGLLDLTDHDDLSRSQ